MYHSIKIVKEMADLVKSGDKKFEIRRNDRNYQVGDAIEFVVINNVSDKMFLPTHPLNDMVFEITSVISGWWLKDGYVALGIKEIQK